MSETITEIDMLVVGAGQAGVQIAGITTCRASGLAVSRAARSPAAASIFLTCRGSRVVVQPLSGAYSMTRSTSLFKSPVNVAMQPMEISLNDP